jgi:hypothetical protein
MICVNFTFRGDEFVDGFEDQQIVRNQTTILILCILVIENLLVKIR